MLPSGNDAAHCLAEYFGGLLKKAQEEKDKKEKEEAKKRAMKEQEEFEKDPNKYLSTQEKEMNAQSTSSGGGEESKEKRDIVPRETTTFKSNINLFSDQSFNQLPGGMFAHQKGSLGSKDKERDLPAIRKSPYVARTTHFKNHEKVLYFLEEMNKQGEEIGLKGSTYDSPHGLSNLNNKSTALDVAKLSTEAMKLKLFREVVGTKTYTLKKGTNGNRKTYKWFNTHLMLGQRGINGIKTGITPTAGPCLCTSINLDGIELIIVIIQTKSMDIRWPETWKLANWAMHRLRTIEKFQNQKQETTNDPI